MIVFYFRVIWWLESKWNSWVKGACLFASSCLPGTMHTRCLPSNSQTVSYWSNGLFKLFLKGSQKQNSHLWLWCSWTEGAIFYCWLAIEFHLQAHTWYIVNQWEGSCILFLLLKTWCCGWLFINFVLVLQATCWKH